eukprot:838294-Prymnesium_polylepis.1
MQVALREAALESEEQRAQRRRALQLGADALAVLEPVDVVRADVEREATVRLLEPQDGHARVPDELDARGERGLVAQRAREPLERLERPLPRHEHHQVHVRPRQREAGRARAEKAQPRCRLDRAQRGGDAAQRVAASIEVGLLMAQARELHHLPVQGTSSLLPRRVRVLCLSDAVRSGDARRFARPRSPLPSH